MVEVRLGRGRTSNTMKRDEGGMTGDYLTIDDLSLFHITFSCLLV